MIPYRIPTNSSWWEQGPILQVASSRAVDSSPRVAVANSAEGCIEASDQPFAESCGLP
jgi:hypothetical protein